MGAVDGVDGPFAVVHRGVVEGAQGDGVVDIGGAAVCPGFQMVDLAPGGDDCTGGGLATAVPGQDGAALVAGEGAVGAALVEHTVVLVPDLAHDLTITGQFFGIHRMQCPHI